MRQASWIAFLLLGVGLLTYDAALDEGTATTSVSEEAAPPSGLHPEGGLGFPPPKP